MNTNVIDFDVRSSDTISIRESHFALINNYEIANCANNYPYMTFDFSTLEPQLIKIRSNSGRVFIQIKHLSISTLNYSKITN